MYQRNDMKITNLSLTPKLYAELMNCIITCNEKNIKKIHIESEETIKINQIIKKVFDNFDIESEIVNISEKYSNNQK